MNFRAFNNYLNEIFNAINVQENHHDERAENHFAENGRWALRLLERMFKDKDHNIRRWFNCKPCVYINDRNQKLIEINIGKDREALYYFLVFCKKIHDKQEISEELRDYLTLQIIRSCAEHWEEC